MVSRPPPLRPRRARYVKDLTSFVVKSTHEIDQVMQAGKKNRSVGSTLMNQVVDRGDRAMEDVFVTSDDLVARG